MLNNSNHNRRVFRPEKKLVDLINDESNIEVIIAHLQSFYQISLCNFTIDNSYPSNCIKTNHINEPNDKHETPIYLVLQKMQVDNRYEPVFQELMQRGADIRRAALRAAALHDVGILKTIFAQRKDTNKTWKDMFLSSTVDFKTQITHLLLEVAKHPSPNDKKTEEIIHFLIDNGADPLATDSEGQTALMLSLTPPNKAVIRALFSHPKAGEYRTALINKQDHSGDCFKLHYAALATLGLDIKALLHQPLPSCAELINGINRFQNSRGLPNTVHVLASQLQANIQQNNKRSHDTGQVLVSQSQTNVQQNNNTAAQEKGSSKKRKI